MFQDLLFYWASLLCIFLLGMVMIEVGIYALTLPILMPIISTLGYDPIWFGVIVIKLSEIAAVTPPVGMNVYMAKGRSWKRGYVGTGIQRDLAILFMRYHSFIFACGFSATYFVVTKSFVRKITRRYVKCMIL
ncbi:TRAP transporter large permease subunit [Acetomicrobium sp.]|uniref:TRAP transporter large permease subunit n=1 Tax=Acetomicrobium sp. TaxID=1872099 RepID=UPI002FCAE643